MELSFKVFTCRPVDSSQEQPCAKEILSTLARRAYRRPTTPADLEWVWGFYQQGRQEGTFQDGIELALRRILTSPQFLVRAEREPANAVPGQPYRITDLELASRLSFMLWSSIPDDELIAVASQNKLHIAPVLDQQVRRMLARSLDVVRPYLLEGLLAGQGMIDRAYLEGILDERAARRGGEKLLGAQRLGRLGFEIDATALQGLAGGVVESSQKAELGADPGRSWWARLRAFAEPAGEAAL